MSPSVGSLITDMLDQSGDEGGREGLILVNIPVLFPLPLRGLLQEGLHLTSLTYHFVN